MSTLAEIESAVEALPPRQQRALFSFLASRLGVNRPVEKHRRGLKAAARPALEGLPSDLSTGTRERVRAMVKARYAADR